MAERPTGDGSSPRRVLVLGHIVRGPVGGMAWHHLQYVVGLSRLGHDVYFVEDSQDYPACYDPDRGVTDGDPAYGLEFARRAFAMSGLDQRWTYYDAHTDRWLGPAAAHAPDLCTSADVLLNMSGKNPLRRWFQDIPHRVLVDTDPAFTQIRHLEDPAAMDQARAHTAFLTFAENVQDGSARLPDDGLPWLPTRQPVVLDAWPVVPAPVDGALTTVMLWDSYQEQEWDGVHYGMKSAAFEPYLDLPGRVAARLELAVGSPRVPKDRLRSHGWTLLDPLAVTRSPADYQAFLQGSRAEFSVAKQGYVVSNSGWFSERSAAYLASGRPVVVQDTGFSSRLPTGDGLLAFRTIDQAVACIEDLAARYDHHAAAARRIAAEHFDAATVLRQLLFDACRSAAPSPERTP